MTIAVLIFVGATAVGYVVYQFSRGVLAAFDMWEDDRGRNL